ncbi:glycosyltransferase [Enterobacter cloacae]|uniref:glycosyltransferase n=1 Tax=Enterobacter cloacae complex sp. 382A5 TaxID=3395855 RepID=UPI002FC433F4
MEKIAVIMSVYREDNSLYIKQAIESILSQTYSEIKLFIMVDGQVSKNINDLLHNYSSHKKIEIFRRDINKGLAHSLNELIDVVVAKKEYKFIARMDSDDISLPHRLEEQINYFHKKQEVDVIGSFCHEFGSSYALDIKKIPLTHEDLVKYTFYKCPFIHPTVMFRVRVFDNKQNRYPLQTRLSEDLALWFKLLIYGYRFGNVDAVLLNYRLDDKTLERRSGFKKALSELKIRLSFAIKMREFDPQIYGLIIARGVFALCPKFIKRIMYKKCR